MNMHPIAPGIADEAEELLGMLASVMRKHDPGKLTDELDAKTQAALDAITGTQSPYTSGTLCIAIAAGILASLARDFEKRTMSSHLSYMQVVVELADKVYHDSLALEGASDEHSNDTGATSGTH